MGTILVAMVTGWLPCQPPILDKSH